MFLFSFRGLERTTRSSKYRPANAMLLYSPAVNCMRLLARLLLCCLFFCQFILEHKFAQFKLLLVHKPCIFSIFVTSGGGSVNGAVCTGMQHGCSDEMCLLFHIRKSTRLRTSPRVSHLVLIRQSFSLKQGSQVWPYTGNSMPMLCSLNSMI